MGKGFLISKQFTQGESEASRNLYTLRTEFFALCIVMLIVLLNALDIFIIDDTLMYVSLGIASADVMVTALIMNWCDCSAPWVKYMVIFSFVTLITIMGVALTYQAVLAGFLPLLCAAQYRSRKMIIYTYVLCILSSFISVMGGYFMGLCDANMLVLTVGTMQNYYDPETGMALFGEINQNPWLSLPLYYAFPRCLILLSGIPIINHISDVISRNAVREAELKQLSETDSMTRLYNKNKYLSMMKEYYPSVKQLGVIFWDVNGLKAINDEVGHEYGDYLISNVAASVHEVAVEHSMAYRVGGDEFVMIVENADEAILESIIAKWNRSMEIKNQGSKIKLSAAVGYALGSGADITSIVGRADSEMYRNKAETKLAASETTTK